LRRYNEKTGDIDMNAIAVRLRKLPPLAKIDRAWAAIAAIVLVLFVAVPAQGWASVSFAAGNLLETAPYLLLSIGIAAYAGASGADNLIARVFTGNPISMIFAAAAFGALSPFCSCGVIPLIAALLAMGVPLAPVMAFWLASPVIDPSMFVLTAGVLGNEFAVAKLITAIGLGLFGGFTTYALARAGRLSDPLREGVGNGGCGGGSVRAPKPVVWTFWHEAPRVERFGRDALKTTLFLGKWLTLAFLLESLMLAYIPAEWIARSLGGEGIGPIATATVVGVPAYLNGYAALPLVSGLIGQGMLPGAGMAFLVAGGVTSIPAAIAVFALVKRPVFLLYLCYALTGSFAAGLLYQGWVA
jgi:uncharacterized membrane protein YraQ (UPF0718 family)